MKPAAPAVTPHHRVRRHAHPEGGGEGRTWGKGALSTALMSGDMRNQGAGGGGVGGFGLSAAGQQLRHGATSRLHSWGN